MSGKLPMNDKLKTIAVLAWLVAFPILFIAVPAYQSVFGEEVVWFDPIWGIFIWVFAPVILGWFLRKQGQNENK